MFTFLGRSSVPVYPGLQSSVQADIRTALPRTLADPGCEGPFWAQYRSCHTQEGHCVWNQGPALLQRVSRNGQWIQDSTDYWGRYEVEELAEYMQIMSGAIQHSESNTNVGWRMTHNTAGCFHVGFCHNITAPLHFSLILRAEGICVNVCVNACKFVPVCLTFLLCFFVYDWWC